MSVILKYFLINYESTSRGEYFLSRLLLISSLKKNSLLLLIIFKRTHYAKIKILLSNICQQHAPIGLETLWTSRFRSRHRRIQYYTEVLCYEIVFQQRLWSFCHRICRTAVWLWTSLRRTLASSLFDIPSRCMVFSYTGEVVDKSEWKQEQERFEQASSRVSQFFARKESIG